MDQLDLLYRAFLDYRKNTAEDPACRKLRKATARAAADKDKVESIRSKCTIEEDWVIAIEEGLPFVEKSIMEERQFIRQEGSIIPIEKVRHVSKNSVEHLARHGNLITRAPEDPEDDLVPDKLYVVENLSNYAVYENRFLYMLLCYLRDFIDLRYNKIMELGNTYKADMTMTKTVSVGKRTITYDTHFFEEARNDPYSKMDPKTGNMIERIGDMQKNINILLNTPLMREVSTAPMLKPPITRTNALRMDNALRQALALYDFVASYQKPGYKVETIKKTYNPFPETMADEFSELVVLSSFLVYEYGNNLKSNLKEAYDAEERRREEEAAEQLRRRILDLRSRVKNDGHTMEEYILLLEERNRYLEPFVTELEAAKAKIAEQEAAILALNEESHRLREVGEEQKAQIEQMKEEMSHLSERHEAELSEMREAHEQERAELQQKHEEEVSLIKEEHARETAEAQARHNEDMSLLKQTHEEEIETIKNQHADHLMNLREDYDDQVREINDACNARMEEQEAELLQTRNTCNELTVKNHDLKSQLHGLRQAHGLKGDVDDYTSEERFEELVKELEALDRLLGQEWKKAKKKIRNEYLWKKTDA